MINDENKRFPQLNLLTLQKRAAVLGWGGSERIGNTGGWGQGCGQGCGACKCITLGGGGVRRALTEGERSKLTGK